jgi:glutathione synthase/RimK-type ligase-like ATP-grasp enzyme
VTCSELPDLDVDDVPLVAALADRRVAATIVPWDDPQVDWAAFDVVVVRSAWDYSTRRDEFVAWARSVPNIVNTASVIEWNTDKAYLKELADRGISTIPTVWLDPDRNLSARAVHTRMPAHGDFVIKPTVSAGSKDTGRYDAGDATERALAIAHAVNLLASGRHVMIQPYLTEIDEIGETSLVYLDGRFSHAVNRRALLSGPYDPSDHSVYVEEELSAAEATPEERELADRSLAVAAELRAEAERPLYARVDVVPGADGVPHLIELEMAEPSLFLRHGDDAHERFADAIALRALRARVL